MMRLYQGRGFGLYKSTSTRLVCACKYKSFRKSSRRYAQIATHFCTASKGNPLFHGFYDTIAKSVASIPYDGYFVEYDDARSGTFNPWAVLKGTDRTFVAGLISTKRPKLEEHDAIKERYEQAKAVVGENIALSPQCGFAL